MTSVVTLTYIVKNCRLNRESWEFPMRMPWMSWQNLKGKIYGSSRVFYGNNCILVLTARRWFFKLVYLKSSCTISVGICTEGYDYHSKSYA